MRTPSHLPDHTTDLGHQIYLVDTGFGGRPGFDGAYLVVSDGRAAFIDTGHNDAVERLLGALAAVGLAPEAVDWVIPTHVHLDHAGGAGLLMTKLPNARALIHPRGARHLITPLALVEGARAVYGADEVRRTYGTIEPIPAERVVESHDGLVVHVGTRPLRLIDTPGHARHHHCIWDERSRGWFTGDTFGISYREFDCAAGPWLFPSTTPVQFEPDALRRSVDRLLEARPQALYLTHFGRITQVERAAAQFLATLEAFEQAAHVVRADHPDDAPARAAALRTRVEATLLQAARTTGSTVADDVARTLLDTDITLNAQGIHVWLSRATS
jgi:glyoxylase-like metal-dependent hydrolase (beta-lactamase superfamily II)